MPTRKNKNFKYNPMFHILFDARGAELISEAMNADEALDGETILMKDDYSIGPINDLQTEEGRIHRKNWFSTSAPDKKVFLADQLEDISDVIVLSNIIHRMEEEEFDQIWIWIAPNARDICGYYWLISQLKKFAGRVYVLHLNNLPFIGEKGNVFYPLFLAEIPSREFVKAKKLARQVTASEFETDPDEWDRIVKENKNLRLLEGAKKIIQKDDDHFDRNILHSLQPSFQKSSRAVHQFLLKSPEKVSESFIFWRLRQLTRSGAIEQQGETIRFLLKSVDESAVN
jgi:Domain of unknown function (DUF1835)/Protein of unknown function